MFTHQDQSTAVSVMRRTVTIPLSLSLSLSRPSSVSCTVSGWLAGWLDGCEGGGGGCHGDRFFLIRSPAWCSIQKKNSPHWSPWKHTSSECSSLPGPLPHPKPSGVCVPRHPTSCIPPPDFPRFSLILKACPAARACLCVCVCLPGCA